MSGKLYQVQNGQKVDVTPTIAALTDVSTKADVTLGNLTAAGNVALAHAAMPSEQYIDLTLPANGGTITAPADGYVALGAGPGSVTAFETTLRMANIIERRYKNPQGTGGLYSHVPVYAGANVQVAYSAGGEWYTLKFIYANGSAPQP